MDAEQLRSTYNQYFSTQKSNWSSTDVVKTEKVAHQTLRWLTSIGGTTHSKTMLDVGCASGYYTEAFRKAGWNAIGLDYSDVAIENASREFPQCTFVQMNGFEPTFQQSFDLIFCRGFSGVNTHDLDFIAGWVNNYLPFLNEGGCFVLSYSSNFSGEEAAGETVNHSREELHQLAGKINARYQGLFIFHYFGRLSQVKKWLERKLLGRKKKEYYSLLFKKIA